MDVDLLSQFVKLMAANDLNTVDVRDGGKRVILKRGPVQFPMPATMHPVFGSFPSATAAAAQAPSPPANDESTYIQIKSPMVGTFYAAPAKGQKTFVNIGSAVEEDSDVCVVEAMKVFNNIKAECRGTIAKILVQDSQPVEFGQLLFLVKPS